MSFSDLFTRFDAPKTPDLSGRNANDTKSLRIQLNVSVWAGPHRGDRKQSGRERRGRYLERSLSQTYLKTLTGKCVNFILSLQRFLRSLCTIVKYVLLQILFSNNVVIGWLGPWLKI